MEGESRFKIRCIRLLVLRSWGGGGFALDWQRSPEVIQQRNGFRRAAAGLDQCPIPFGDHCFLRGKVEKADKSVEVAIGIDQQAGLRVDAQLQPGDGLKKFIERTVPTRQRNKRVGERDHSGFALMHSLDDKQATQGVMRDLTSFQGTGNHAKDFAAAFERSVGDCAHQPHLGAAVDQSEARLRQQCAKLGCVCLVNGASPGVRRAEDTGAPPGSLLKILHHSFQNIRQLGRLRLPGGER